MNAKAIERDYLKRVARVVRQVCAEQKPAFMAAKGTYQLTVHFYGVPRRGEVWPMQSGAFAVPRSIALIRGTRFKEHEIFRNRLWMDFKIMDARNPDKVIFSWWVGGAKWHCSKEYWLGWDGKRIEWSDNESVLAEIKRDFTEVFKKSLLK